MFYQKANGRGKEGRNANADHVFGRIRRGPVLVHSLHLFLAENEGTTSLGYFGANGRCSFRLWR